VNVVAESFGRDEVRQYYKFLVQGFHAAACHFAEHYRDATVICVWLSTRNLRTVSIPPQSILSACPNFSSRLGEFKFAIRFTSMT
jgi:hypothetical protein